MESLSAVRNAGPVGYVAESMVPAGFDFSFLTVQRRLFTHQHYQSVDRRVGLLLVACSVRLEHSGSTFCRRHLCPVQRAVLIASSEAGNDRVCLVPAVAVVLPVDRKATRPVRKADLLPHRRFSRLLLDFAWRPGYSRYGTGYSFASVLLAGLP